MKKFISAILILFNVMLLQGQDWTKDKDFEALLTKWDIAAEAWISTTPDGKTALTIKDLSTSSYEVKKQLQTSLFAISSQLKQLGKTFKTLNIAYIGYSWISEDGRIDVILDNDWLTTYFNSESDKEKLSMINTLSDKLTPPLPQQKSPLKLKAVPELPPANFPLKQ